MTDVPNKGLGELYNCLLYFMKTIFQCGNLIFYDSTWTSCEKFWQLLGLWIGMEPPTLRIWYMILCKIWFMWPRVNDQMSVFNFLLFQLSAQEPFPKIFKNKIELDERQVTVSSVGVTFCLIFLVSNKAWTSVWLFIIIPNSDSVLSRLVHQLFWKMHSKRFVLVMKDKQFTSSQTKCPVCSETRTDIITAFSLLPFWARHG